MRRASSVPLYHGGLHGLECYAVMFSFILYCNRLLCVPAVRSAGMLYFSILCGAVKCCMPFIFHFPALYHFGRSVIRQGGLKGCMRQISGLYGLRRVVVPSVRLQLLFHDGQIASGRDAFRVFLNSGSVCAQCQQILYSFLLKHYTYLYMCIIF